MAFLPDEITEMLSALDEQLAATQSPPVQLVICGGTAMNALGFVSRPTRDVDVVALIEAVTTSGKQLVSAAPLPGYVVEARNRIADDFAVSQEWLNDGPASLMDLGLPAGCEERLVSRRIGPCLTLHFLSRVDLICLKLYAWADTGTARHLDDLRALAPTQDELAFAGPWVMTHNEPEGFLPGLQKALIRLGAPDVAASLG